MRLPSSNTFSTSIFSTWTPISSTLATIPAGTAPNAMLDVVLGTSPINALTSSTCVNAFEIYSASTFSWNDFPTPGRNGLDPCNRQNQSRHLRATTCVHMGCRLILGLVSTCWRLSTSGTASWRSIVRGRISDLKIAL